MYAELVEVDEMIVMDVVAELDKMRIIKVVTEPEKTTKRERRDGRRRERDVLLLFDATTDGTIGLNRAIESNSIAIVEMKRQ